MVNKKGAQIKIKRKIEHTLSLINTLRYFSPSAKAANSS